MHYSFYTSPSLWSMYYHYTRYVILLSLCDIFCFCSILPDKWKIFYSKNLSLNIISIRNDSYLHLFILPIVVHPNWYMEQTLIYWWYSRPLIDVHISVYMCHKMHNEGRRRYSGSRAKCAQREGKWDQVGDMRPISYWLEQ